MLINVLLLSMKLISFLLDLPKSLWVKLVAHLRKYHTVAHKYLNGFLIGMMCEYLYRVEVSPYPIVLIFILLIEIMIVETQGHKEK